MKLFCYLSYGSFFLLQRAYLKSAFQVKVTQLGPGATQRTWIPNTTQGACYSAIHRVCTQGVFQVVSCVTFTWNALFR